MKSSQIFVEAYKAFINLISCISPSESISCKPMLSFFRDQTLSY